jgi:hypothetical protein
VVVSGANFAAGLAGGTQKPDTPVEMTK